MSLANRSLGCATEPVLISLITARPDTTNCINVKASTEKPSDQGNNLAGAGQFCGSQTTQIRKSTIAALNSNSTFLRDTQLSLYS